MEERALTIQQKAGTLGNLLNQKGFRERLQECVPQWLTVDRLIRLFLSTAYVNPKIYDCSDTSILVSCVQCAQLGLEPILGRAWLIPYWNGKKHILECQMQPGYQGLIDLARRSGNILDVYALNVYENDEFDINFGSNRSVHHRPWYMNKSQRKAGPGEIWGAYAIWLLKDGTQHPEFMYIDDIHKRRDKSPAYNFSESGDPKKGGSKKDSIWHLWSEEQNAKTVIKHSAKTVPASIEYMQGVQMDNYVEAGMGPYFPDPEKALKFGNFFGLPGAEGGAGAGRQGYQPGRGEDPFNKLQDELIGKGLTVQEIDDFIKEAAKSANMTVEDTRKDAVERKESFMEAAISYWKQLNFLSDLPKYAKTRETAIDWLKVLAEKSSQPEWEKVDKDEKKRLYKLQTNYMKKYNLDARGNENPSSGQDDQFHASSENVDKFVDQFNAIAEELDRDQVEDVLRDRGYLSLDPKDVKDLKDKEDILRDLGQLLDQKNNS